MNLHRRTAHIQSHTFFAVGTCGVLLESQSFLPRSSKVKGDCSKWKKVLEEKEASVISVKGF